MIEIEKKYLVHKDLWNRFKRDNALTYTEIKQGYLFSDNSITGRVRSKIDRISKTELGFLTLKGPTKGISRVEFEYEIPVSEVNEMLSIFCASYIHKKRFTFLYNGKTWEVDEFLSPNPQLILAEIELKFESEVFDLPPFIAEDVSSDAKYYNVNMLKV